MARTMGHGGVDDYEQTFLGGGGKRYRKIFGLTYKSPRQISLSSMSLPVGRLHLQVIRKQMPLETDPSVNIVNWVHRKSGHHSA